MAHMITLALLYAGILYSINLCYTISYDIPGAEDDRRLDREEAGALSTSDAG